MRLIFDCGSACIEAVIVLLEFMGVLVWVLKRDMVLRPIFWGFCIIRFLMSPLHYLSSCSDSAFEFAEIFIIEKRLPDSSSIIYHLSFFTCKSCYECKLRKNCLTGIDQCAVVLSKKYKKAHLWLFGSSRTEWGHLANTQIAWHSYHQEPVALQSLNSNASMKQDTLKIQKPPTTLIYACN